MNASRIPADHLPDYVSTLEGRIASELVSELIASGFVLSVNDGEAWPVQRSADAREVCAALASTDADWLRASLPTLNAMGAGGGTHAGTVMLVWGNGADLISDWTLIDTEAGRKFQAVMETTLERYS